MLSGAALAPMRCCGRCRQPFPETPDTGPAFGQTEMSPVTCMLLGEDAIASADRSARPSPQGWSIRNTNDVPVGEVGEIVHRATLMSRYWNNPRPPRAFAGGCSILGIWFMDLTVTSGGGPQEGT